LLKKEKMRQKKTSWTPRAKVIKIHWRAKAARPFGQKRKKREEVR